MMIASPCVAVVINEIDPNQASAVDSAEFIELFGTPLMSLNGYAVVLFNGATDTSYQSYDLDGYVLGPTGYFLLGTTGVTPTPDITFPNNTLQNGADAVALYLANGADFPNGTGLTTSNLLDAIVYGNGHPNDTGLLTGLSQATQFDEDALGTADVVSIGRSPNGTGSFNVETPTPIASGIPQAPEPTSLAMLSQLGWLGLLRRRRSTRQPAV
jgi:hypothetical protein